MRVQIVFLLLTSVGVSLYAQGSPELDRAKAELARLKDLAAMGAIPRVRVEQAQYNVADAEDDAVLRQTLFGNVTVEQLSEQQAQDMVAAAQRRVDRQNERIASAQKLVDMGVTARDTVQPLEEELGVRKQTLTLAQTRANLLHELAAMVRSEHLIEEDAPAAPVNKQLMIHYAGTSLLSDLGLVRLESAYAKTFSHPLPISAHGETAVHRALGFDHRGRIDVAVNPDQREGVWLRTYLEKSKIPYFAFRSAIAGKATGPHIHIGPPSQRLRAAD